MSASLGGALERDKVWYFVSAKAVADKRTSLGALDSEDRSIRRLLGKATWQVDEGNRVLLLADYDGQDTERRGISATTVDPRVGMVWDLRGDARTAVKAHFGRYQERMFTYLYDREESGNVFTPSYFCAYNFDTGQFDTCSSPQGGAAAMDAGIDHPSVDQWVASVEQQLGKNMALGIDYVRRQFRDIVAMVNTVDDYDELVAPGNPLTGGDLPFYDLLSRPAYLLTKPGAAFRDYDSWVLRFDKRYANG